MNLDDLLKERPCKRCGDCCRAFVNEVSEADLIREPKLRDHIKPISEAKGSVNKKNGNKWFFSEPHQKPCPFLIDKSGICECEIYETRPLTCRQFVSAIITCKTVELEMQKIDVIATMEHLQRKGFTTEQTFDILMKL